MFVLQVVCLRIVPPKWRLKGHQKKRLTILARKVKHYGQKG